MSFIKKITLVHLATIVLSIAVGVLATLTWLSDNTPEDPSATSEAPIVVDYRDCRHNQQEQVSFVLECIKNGNPMSDEEPEDLVIQCQSTAINLFCPLRTQVMKRVDFKKSNKHMDGEVYRGGGFLVDDSGELLSIEFTYRAIHNGFHRR